MLCHAAICSSGSILHTTACPDMNGQFDVVIFPSPPIGILEWKRPKKPIKRKAMSPRTSSILPTFDNETVITSSIADLDKRKNAPEV